MSGIRRFIVAAGAAAFAWSASVASAQHEGDVIVGRTAAGQLKIGGFIPDLNIVVLPPTDPKSPFNGWSDVEPGFDHLVTSEPQSDWFILQAGAQIRLEVVAVDPAFKAVDTSFNVLDQPGQQTLLGGATLHNHVIWLIDADDPAYDPARTLWRATFKLVDTGSTGYAESDPFTFYFANLDCARDGDLNGDGRVNGEDIQAYAAVAFDPPAATAEERCAADLDRDGLVTSADAAALAAALVSG